MVLEPVAATATDRWENPTRGVRIVHRTTHHADGRGVIVHAAFVDLCTPGFRFRVSSPTDGRKITSAWADTVGALVAVNGDFFDGAPAHPLGPSRGNGVWWPDRSVYFFSGWLGMSPGRPVTLVDSHHTPSVWPTSYADTEVISFQEHVVVAGRVHLSDFVIHGGRAPRTGVGITADATTFVFVTVDGRTSSSIGATTEELAGFMTQLGVWEGVRFDGGGSTTLFVHGRGVVNHVSDGKERLVANHLGIVVDATAPLPPACSAH